MNQKQQFSLLSLLLVMLVIAMGALTFNYCRTALKAASLHQDAEARVVKEQAARDALLKQNEAEFFGHFPPPILAVDPMLNDSPPNLYAIFNSKSLPQQRTAGIRQPDNLVKQYRFKLELLRTLDRKDYYRLLWYVFAPDEVVDEKKWNELLFAYDGTSLKLVNEESIHIALSPNRVAAIEALAAMRPSNEAETLKAKWQSSARVEVNSIPSTRGDVNLQQFNQ